MANQIAVVVVVRKQAVGRRRRGYRSGEQYAEADVVAVSGNRESVINE